MRDTSFRILLLLALAFAVAGFSCQTGTTEKGKTTTAVTNADSQAGTNAKTQATGGGADANASTTTAEAPVYRFEVVNTWPHDSSAFTQGLIFHDGAFLESAGQYGQSSLRRVEPKTGKVVQQVAVPPQFFAEGMTLFRGKIYQLTWQHHRGFIYDPKSFQKVGEFRYDGEGWGLTHDGESLILSDGTNQLRFIDPESFEVRRTISVVNRGQPVRELNELEYVKGEIYANIWHANRIVRVDAQTGKVAGWIDLEGIISRSELSDDEAVLNGIAYDEAADRLFVTGKLWPKIFEIRLKK